MEYVIGLTLGLVLGLTGAGGSVFGVPLIIVFLNKPVNEAMATALGAVMLTAVYGAVIQRKNVQILPALILGLFGMISAPIGRSIANHINDVVLLIGFCLISLFVAVCMWQNSTGKPSNVGEKFIRKILSRNHKSRISRESTFGYFSADEIKGKRFRLMAGYGLGIGFFSGMFGVGGGVLIVPLITRILGASMQAALATSFLVIALVSMSGFTASWILHDQVDPVLMAKLSAAGIVGMIMGQKIGARFSDTVLQRIFSAALISISVFAATTVR